MKPFLTKQEKNFLASLKKCPECEHSECFHIETDRGDYCLVPDCQCAIELHKLSVEYWEYRGIPKEGQCWRKSVTLKEQSSLPAKEYCHCELPSTAEQMWADVQRRSFEVKEENLTAIAVTDEANTADAVRDLGQTADAVNEVSGKLIMVKEYAN